MEHLHDRITNRLSDYLDEELGARERAEVDTHLGECARCRSVLEELKALTEAARRLAGRLPDRELWEGIEARIAPELAAPAVSAPPARRRFAFTLPQLAAAALALMVMSGGLVYVARSSDPAPAGMPAATPEGGMAVSPVSLPDPQFEDAIGDLERTLAAGRDRLDPATIRVLEESLQTIDRAIAQSREALDADPGNVFLNSHLMAARQRKLALLRRATALTTGS